MYFLKKKGIYIFTPQEKANAHNTSTVDFLGKNYGLHFKRESSGFRCEEHNSLFIHGDERSWYWNSRGVGGGDVIEWLKKIENKTYEQALVEIYRPTPDPSAATSYSYAKARENQSVYPEKRRDLLLPPKQNGRFVHAYAYLTKSRHIDENIVKVLMHKNFIYEDSRNNVVFVGYNKTGLPAYAAVRSSSTTHKYRKEAIGSDKSTGFYLHGYDKSTVYVFEAPIDLLSHATLENLKSGNPKQWLNATRLSLGGVSDNALKGFLADHKENIENIVFCLDNDPAGLEATAKLCSKYGALGYNVSAATPKAKDYNDELAAYLSQTQVQKQPMIKK